MGKLIAFCVLFFGAVGLLQFGWGKYEPMNFVPFMIIIFVLLALAAGFGLYANAMKAENEDKPAAPAAHH